MSQGIDDSKEDHPMVGSEKLDSETSETRQEAPRMFSSELASRSARHGDVWRRYQIAYDLNDLGAGLLFVIGSILFFDDSAKVAASTLFLIGSISFCVRPLIHVLRDFHLMRLPE